MAETIYTIVSLASLLLIYVIALQFRMQAKDPREPIFTQPRIPLLRQVIGLVQYGGAYYTRLRYSSGALNFVMKSAC